MLAPRTPQKLLHFSVSLQKLGLKILIYFLLIIFFLISDRHRRHPNKNIPSENCVQKSLEIIHSLWIHVTNMIYSHLHSCQSVFRICLFSFWCNFISWTCEVWTWFKISILYPKVSLKMHFFCILSSPHSISWSAFPTGTWRWFSFIFMASQVLQCESVLEMIQPFPYGWTLTLFPFYNISQIMLPEQLRTFLLIHICRIIFFR